MNLQSNSNGQVCENPRESLPDLERKIDSITKTLSRPYFNKILKDLLKTNPVNAKTIVDYILTEQTEINIKDSTKESKIKILVWLSNFHNNKSFIELKKQDILEYLNNLRKTTVEDPSNRWVGTYNGRQIMLSKFFKWLYHPDEDYRERSTPICMHGIRKLPRKEKTSYKPSDIWEAREHVVFLKYCPYKRDRCYHALARDMSARPHEILNLKFRDVKFNFTNEGIQYAEVRITQGKTGPRTVPLIDSIPYLKEWMEEHPNGKNPDSFIFISQGNNHGSKLTLEGLSSHYDYYKKKYFTKILDDNTVPDYDKAIIKNMLTKPWNLYVYRHSALTEKSLILPDSALKDHAGWSMGSKMTQTYVHLSGQSSKVLLQKNGILNFDHNNSFDCLKPRQCPNCNESNKQDSKFCTKCRMVLNYDAYSETLEEQKKKEGQIKRLEEKYETGMKQMKEEIENKLQQIMTKIDISRV
ncbi:tyrosine-type recombinase/integrase [soil metagenome]